MCRRGYQRQTQRLSSERDLASVRLHRCGWPTHELRVWTPPAPKQQIRTHNNSLLRLPKGTPCEIHTPKIATTQWHRWDRLAVPLLSDLLNHFQLAYAELAELLWLRLAECRPVESIWARWTESITPPHLALEMRTATIHARLAATLPAPPDGGIRWVVLPIAKYEASTPHHATNISRGDGYLPIDLATMACLLAGVPYWPQVGEQGNVGCLGSLSGDGYHQVPFIEPALYQRAALHVTHHAFDLSAGRVSSYALAVLPAGIIEPVPINQGNVYDRPQAFLQTFEKPRLAS